MRKNKKDRLHSPVKKIASGHTTHHQHHAAGPQRQEAGRQIYYTASRPKIKEALYMTYHADKDQLSRLQSNYNRLNDEGKENLLDHSEMLCAVARNTGKYRPGVISISYLRCMAAKRGRKA